MFMFSVAVLAGLLIGQAMVYRIYRDRIGNTAIKRTVHALFVRHPRLWSTGSLRRDGAADRVSRYLS
jgi:hypothetical protein